MSSVIELYEHNQKAYDALLDMLGERDRACIIKPTGTGKFVIIAKMVQDNPDKRFLLLGTNVYMFNDQMANLAEIAPGFTPENLQFMTYAATMGMERRNDCVPPYDVIIADEFHHCGAEEWGKGVTHILNANESAKVVGFTATPIRYSDGGRNMADEMFDGNVAYSMELEEAWLRGILPIPKWATSRRLVLFVRDIWSIVLKIYLVWWYDILPVINLAVRKEIPWRVSHRRRKPLSVSRNSGVSRLRCAASCTRRG